MQITEKELAVAINAMAAIWHADEELYKSIKKNAYLRVTEELGDTISEGELWARVYFNYLAE